MQKPALSIALLEFAALTALPLAQARAGTHPAGATIENAALLDVTPQGFDAVAGIIPSFVPDSIPLDDMGDGYEGLWGQCYLGGYEYSLSGAWVSISVADATITPQDGYLDLYINLLVWINDGSDPFELYTELECIGDTCDGHVEPFNAYVTTTISLDIVTGDDGEPVLDATVGELAISYDLTSDHINLDNCAIGTVEDVLNFLGLSLYDLIIDLAAGQIEGAVADFGPQIESTLEDAFGQASISQELDVNGVVITLDLFPADLETTTDGVRVTMNGAMDAAEAATCIADYDPGASEGVDSEPPPLGTVPTGVDPDYHVGILLSDDIGNQALYALWRGGLLCYEVNEESVGITIDTSMLGLLAGDAFDELFPESEPLAIFTRPRKAPTMNYATAHDVAVSIEDLGLEFYGELDHRQAMVLGMGLSADVGADLALDAKTGQLAIEVDLSGDAIDAVVTDNEFVPDASPDIEANFASVFDTLVGTIAGDLLSGLAFDLPSYEGIGLADLQFAPTGTEHDWLGGYAWVGPVSYGGEGSGCGEDSGDGCSGGGCGVTGRPGGRLALLAILPLALASLRRRRERVE